MCVDFIVHRLTDGGELHDGVASLECLENLFETGQVCGDEDKLWIMAELGAFFGNAVDSDDDMACLEGPQVGQRGHCIQSLRSSSRTWERSRASHRSSRPRQRFAYRWSGPDFASSNHWGRLVCHPVTASDLHLVPGKRSRGSMTWIITAFTAFLVIDGELISESNSPRCLTPRRWNRCSIDKKANRCTKMGTLLHRGRAVGGLSEELSHLATAQAPQARQKYSVIRPPDSKFEVAVSRRLLCYTRPGE